MRGFFGGFLLLTFESDLPILPAGRNSSIKARINDLLNSREGGIEMSEKSELRDGMRIDWDVPITMDDGDRKSVCRERV